MSIHEYLVRMDTASIYVKIPYDRCNVQKSAFGQYVRNELNITGAYNPALFEWTLPRDHIGVVSQQLYHIFDGCDCTTGTREVAVQVPPDIHEKAVVRFNVKRLR
jgi:hypothetical protein